jgi:UDP-N-acetylmuramoyl-tripeptide--D-alanyl-D-alanine ligase
MSIPFLVRDAVEWTGGDLLQGDGAALFDGVSIDSRTVAPGQLFVAIQGPTHDGHLFLNDALAAGAAGLLVERGRGLPEGATPALPVIAVDDTTRSLGALAAGHRRGFEGPVVAITGSNGKTTAKEMCAAILSATGSCLKNRGNLNNQFGLPLTLLERQVDHDALVVEIGMNHRGEIAPLAAIANPNVAVITNVGTAHIEFLGSRDEIATEKGDLIAALGEDAVAVLNADDHRVMGQAERTRARILRFGQHAEAEVRAESVTSLGERGFAFDLVTESDRVPVHVGGLGEPTVSNALAGSAAALAAGAPLASVAAGLARYQPMSGRMEQVSLPRNIIVINDTYNANPQSMEVALRSLTELKGESRGVAVLGDMGELGSSAGAAHRATGALVAELGLDFLFALGQFASDIADGATEAGMDPHRVRVGTSHDETSKELRRILQGNDWVLVKGSRSMQMERVVEALARGGDPE